MQIIKVRIRKGLKRVGGLGPMEVVMHPDKKVSHQAVRGKGTQVAQDFKSTICSSRYQRRTTTTKKEKLQRQRRQPRWLLNAQRETRRAGSGRGSLSKRFFCSSNKERRISLSFKCGAQLPSLRVTSAFTAAVQIFGPLNRERSILCYIYLPFFFLFFSLSMSFHL